MIDRDMKKKDLQALAGISSSPIVKFSKNEHVGMDALIKECSAFKVKIEDIME